MGYSTVFSGRAKLIGNIPDGMIDFVNKFNYTRRMARNVDEKYGVEGEFYVLGGDSFGQKQEQNIINYNTPPQGQPSLWCQWQIEKEIVTPYRSIVDPRKMVVENYYLQWDGGEKFYEYVDWLDYLIAKVFQPYNVILAGDINWQGEEDGDSGRIYLDEGPNGIQIMQSDEYGISPYVYPIGFSKLDFLDLLGKKVENGQQEFVF